MLEAVSRVPGVEHGGNRRRRSAADRKLEPHECEIPGRGELKGDDDSIDRRTVSPDTCDLLRIPLLKGRASPDDDRDELRAGRRHQRGRGAQVLAGRRCDRHSASRSTSNERVVVGIVGNIRHLGPETPPRQECYVPLAQDPQHRRDARDADARRSDRRCCPAVKAAIWSVNREQRLTGDTVTLEATWIG